MTHELEDYEDSLNRRWTREEIRKVNARIRATRRRVWWARHGSLIAGLIAFGVAAVAFTILVSEF